jgi:5'-nucleotidase
MRPSTWKAALGATLSAGLLAAPMTALPAYAQDSTAAAPGIIINEAYLSGGSANAPFASKFVELYNPTDEDVSLDGWSLQYRSAGSTAAPTGIGALAGTIPAGGYYLVSGASNGATGAQLPDADASIGASFSGSGGTLILANQATRVDPLPAGSVSATPGVVDLLGYGTSNTFETAAAAAPAGNADPKSLNRTGFADSNNNAADFTLSATVTPTGTGGSAPVEPDPTPTPTPTPSPDPTGRSACRSGNHCRNPGHSRRQPAGWPDGHHPRQGHRRLSHRRLQRVLHPDPRNRRRTGPGRPHGVGRHFCLFR